MLTGSPRLLQAMAGAAHGGAEAFFLRFTLALERAGQPQHVLIRPDATRVPRLRQAGVALTEAPFGGVFDFSTGSAFRAAISDHRPDIVLTWMSRATGFCPPGRGDFTHVARLGGYYDLKHYRRCDHLVGNTPDIVDWLVRQGWPRERSHYLPNFVTRTEQALPASRLSLETPSAAPLILALGRLHPNKGFDTLLTAMADLPDVYLWLGGDGPLEGPLRKQAASLGIAQRVRFLGWREDAPSLMAAANLFVCPSRHEPLGNVVIEAWAQGLPVVAAASTGPQHLIEPEVSGLLARIDDPQALAAAIGRVLAQPVLARQLAAGGTAAFECQFTERAVVARWLDFFAPHCRSAILWLALVTAGLVLTSLL